MHSDDDDNDSLFGSESSQEVEARHHEDPHNGISIASRTAPSVPGLFFFPSLLSRDVHDRVLQKVSACGYFALSEETKSDSDRDATHESYARSSRNQAMLFARSLATPSEQEPSGPSFVDNNFAAGSGLPAWAVALIWHLQQLLDSQSEQSLPAQVKEMLFPSNQLLSRQLILNLYNGAEGLSPHVDLLTRFADGILLCSFGPQGTGTVMDFTHEVRPSQHLFLPSGSVLVLSGEARYEWKHGIAARPLDRVWASDGSNRIQEVKRSIRLSITIRSMLPGADVVGE